MRAFTTMLVAFCAFISTDTIAQKPKTGCIDAAVEAQAKGIKLGLSKKDMKVFQEAMFRMQSMEPVPVAVKMNAGVRYELIFVGSEQASRLTMEIFDGKDNKIDERIERSMNNIVYSFTPQKTDVYLVTLYQKKGMKDLCGYFGVMTKGLTNPVLQPKKETTPAKPAKTTTPSATQTAPQPQTLPDNQRPNPNRTRATREAQQQKGK